MFSPGMVDRGEGAQTSRNARLTQHERCRQKGRRANDMGACGLDDRVAVHPGRGDQERGAHGIVGDRRQSAGQNSDQPKCCDCGGDPPPGAGCVFGAVVIHGRLSGAEILPTV